MTAGAGGAGKATGAAVPAAIGGGAAGAAVAASFAEKLIESTSPGPMPGTVITRPPRSLIIMSATEGPAASATMVTARSRARQALMVDTLQIILYKQPFIDVN
jgi:hypothetical protein